MPDATDDQSAAFVKLLPRLLHAYGAAWIVMVDKEVKGHFPSFEDAANFAISNFPASQFMIRNTQEKAVEFTYIAADG